MIPGLRQGLDPRGNDGLSSEVGREWEKDDPAIELLVSLVGCADVWICRGRAMGRKEKPEPRPDFVSNKIKQKKNYSLPLSLRTQLSTETAYFY